MSDYISDDVINPHPRFATLTRNIRQRRTRKVDIRVPIFRDVYTEARQEEEQASWNAERSRPKYESKRDMLSSPSSSFGSAPTSPSSTSNSEDNADAMSKSPPPPATLRKTLDHDHTRKLSTVDHDSKAEPYPGFIHMDAMAFGMGMCCLQVTFQAKNVGESRHLYDHLGVLSPILLALTAATPILKGRLADTDVRWATISAAVDDRTPQELGEAPPPTDEETKAKYAKMAGNGVKRLPKSRYEGISTFICNHKRGLVQDSDRRWRGPLACASHLAPVHPRPSCHLPAAPAPRQRARDGPLREHPIHELADCALETASAGPVKR
ncbi:hypothetical protein ON010_g16940 [Phytophthora cinnamomi]|nr:hypothetical protein ON010_g16940 [Phytophthora cinnamomi]